MASVYKTFQIAVPATFAWTAIADLGALHERLVRGFVTETVLEGHTRSVRFANGMMVQERILSVDAPRQRLAYSASGGRTTHHNASVQVTETGPHSCEVTWITDLLPDEVGPAVEKMVEAGAEAMIRTLETDYLSESGV